MSLLRRSDQEGRVARKVEWLTGWFRADIFPDRSSTFDAISDTSRPLKRTKNPDIYPNNINELKSS